jgi:tRNA A37 threonylcarbamoyladenosine dehydratase
LLVETAREKISRSSAVSARETNLIRRASNSRYLRHQRCPLARVMRRELKKRSIPALKVLYSSREEPIKISEGAESSCKADVYALPGRPGSCSSRRAVPGSVPFVPSLRDLLSRAKLFAIFSG